MWKWKLLIRIMRQLSRSPAHLEGQLRKLQMIVLDAQNQLTPEWSAHISYPKQPVVDSVLHHSSARVAIVMQGPLRTEDNFTLQTVRLYRQTAPESSVIVSTWQSEDSAQIEAIERAGAQVITSPRPELAGASNINLQIDSTRAGVERACDAGFEFILKTRTDTRMHAPRFLDYLLSLWHTFPSAGVHGVRGRIAALDLPTRVLVPHHLSDILLFGHRDDMRKYWDLPHSQHAPIPPRREKMGELWNRSVPEIYLCEHYCRRVGYSIEPTLASWWRSLAELFIVVDRHSIGHFWPKYGFSVDYSDAIDAHLRMTRVCSHLDWLNLTQGVTPGRFDEDRLRAAHPNDLAARAAA
jgi:hypothetical protein